jgi:hypothetical protein
MSLVWDLIPSIRDLDLSGVHAAAKIQALSQPEEVLAEALLLSLRINAIRM